MPYMIYQKVDEQETLTDVRLERNDAAVKVKTQLSPAKSAKDNEFLSCGF